MTLRLLPMLASALRVAVFALALVSSARAQSDSGAGFSVAGAGMAILSMGSFSGVTTITMGSGLSLAGTNSDDISPGSYDGSIIGSTDGFVPVGAGDLTLGSNTYSGATTIDSGVLQIGNTGALLVNPDGFDFAAAFIYPLALTTPAPGSGTIVGSLQGNGGTVILTGSNTYSGELTLSGPLIGADGIISQRAGQLDMGTMSSFSLVKPAVAVPEPSTWVMVAGGFLTLALGRRKRLL